jgi:soluble lytic murein transglycosylase-like protein
MGKYTTVAIKVPDINRSFVQGSYKYSNSSVASANSALLNEIVSSYLGYINTWGAEFEIDNSIIASFIATESSGINSAPNKYDATGLMQVTPDTVWEVIVKWQKIVKFPLSVKATTFFNKAIPSSKKFNPNILPSTAVKSEIRKALQNNSEFNIAIGTATLRWLLEAFKEGNTVNINKVMVSYNAGYYSMKDKVKGNPTTGQLLLNKRIPLESRAYLLKMLGVNGFLDLWFKKNNVNV